MVIASRISYGLCTTFDDQVGFTEVGERNDLNLAVRLCSTDKEKECQRSTSDIRSGEKRPSAADGRPVQNLIYLLARLAATSLHRQLASQHFSFKEHVILVGFIV